MSETAIASPCDGCDGSGWYTPRFSVTALVNCVLCNEDGSKGYVTCQACGGAGEIGDDDAICQACDGLGEVPGPEAARLTADGGQG